MRIHPRKAKGPKKVIHVGAEKFPFVKLHIGKFQKTKNVLCFRWGSRNTTRSWKFAVKIQMNLFLLLASDGFYWWKERMETQKQTWPELWKQLCLRSVNFRLHKSSFIHIAWLDFGVVREINRNFRNVRVELIKSTCNSCLFKKIYDVLNIQMKINCFLAAAQSQSLLIVDWQIDFFSFCSIQHSWFSPPTRTICRSYSRSMKQINDSCGELLLSFNENSN